MTPDQRRFERIPFFAAVTVAPLPHGRPIEARTFDVSLGGAGLIGPTTVAIGQSLSLVFRLRDRSGKEVAEEVLGRVMHARSDEEATAFGVQFLAPLDRRTTPALVARMERS